MQLVVHKREEEHEAVHVVVHEVVREVVREVGHEGHEEAHEEARVVPVVGLPDAVLDAGAEDLVERMRDSREELARQEVPEAVLAEDLRDPAVVLQGLATFLMFVPMFPVTVRRTRVCLIIKTHTRVNGVDRRGYNIHIHTLAD